MKKSIETQLLQSDKTFKKWKNVPFAERQELLSKLSKTLLEKKEMFAEIITKEMNKPIAQSVSEIEKCAGMCDFYAKAENVLKPEQVETGHEISEIHREPMGVILGIMPWNFPFWQVLRFAIPTLLAGNHCN
mgnify:FL=1